MGASAGAGSGEFDIYRGCRRRELIRQEYLTEQSEKVNKTFFSFKLIIYQKIIFNSILKQKIEQEFEQKRLQNLKEAGNLDMIPFYLLVIYTLRSI